MKDKRIEKIKQHYVIEINNEKFNVLKHRVDTNKSLLTIRSKVFGQHFPTSGIIHVCFPEDGAQPLIAKFKCMTKNASTECFEYYIIT